MKKITIIFMSVLMIFASCSTDIPYDDINKNTETVEEPKEDNSKNNEDEPSNEEDNTENDNDEEGNSENTEIVEEPSNEEDNTENDNDEEPSNEESKEDDSENSEIVEDESSNEDVENKTWCEIGEDTKILGLNYFVCVDNSQIKLSPSINDESRAKKDTFLIRGYADCASKYIEIRVGYNNKLNFSSVSDNYIISNVMKKDSTINITIEWK